MQRYRGVLARLCRSLMVCLAGVVLCAPALANLRAPIIVQYRASSVVATASTGLVVEGEQLFFYLGKPYSGNARDLPHEPRQASVEAVYSIRAEAGVEALFEFIMADAPGRVEVSINARPVQYAEVRPVERVVGSGPYEGRRLPPEAAQVSFLGELQAGSNEIRVRYSQPLGRDEIEYGYFKTSEWASTVAYELWPLHEWKLAPDFRMQIEVSAEDDTFSLRRAIFGSHYVMELRALPMPEPATDTLPLYQGRLTRDGQPLPAGEQIHEPGRLIQRYTLGADFPPRIVAVVREK